MESQSARYGNLLVAAGLKKGDRVAAQVEKIPLRRCYLYLGCLRAGPVFLPLNPACQRREVEYFLDDAKPGLFVCRPETLERGAGTGLGGARAAGA
ncbi:MAG: AMP-binding protein [Rhodocyclaceae bacterium]|nr:AMP-binding protein [Rhodocyclaceae bacterium]